jgi:hypothetical protein
MENVRARRRWFRLLLACSLGLSSALWCLASRAHPAVAQDAAGQAPSAPAPDLLLTAPEEIRAGQRAALRVTLTLPPGYARNVLLTPSVEGEALDVVRGRLMGGDALDPEARPLVFELPLLARTPGRSVVRVHALTYRCDARCVAVAVEARASLLVLP